MPGTMPIRRLFTPEEYLLIERGGDYKSEYLDGEIFAMSGATMPHNQIAGNLFMELGLQLVDKPCRLFVSDMRVGVTAHGPYFYPDVLVVCGEPQHRDGTQDCLMNPALIVEVLSPSTENYDRVQKFASYRQIATLTDYLLIAQDEPRIEHFSRQSGGGWLLNTITGLDRSLHLTSIAGELPLAKVYRRVEFQQ
jgi:Uma2 family endonuclease